MSLESTTSDLFVAPSLAGTTGTFRRLLVPVEFNDATQCAVAEALELRQRLGSEVNLFRYAEPDEATRFLAGTGADGLTAQVIVDGECDRLRRFVENVFPGHADEVSVHASVGVGVADAILKEAARLDATLVLLGVPRKPHLLRTEIEKLVQRLTCPVLLIRPRHDHEPH
jgi:nucleotide-binding universal stress UspA family protein